MIGFNQKNIIDIPSNNKQPVGFNKISHPYENLVKRGNMPIDLWNFQQRCEKLENEGILTKENNNRKQLIVYEDLKLPELMPYRNHTPPYQKERYKQNMKMKSLDTILKYKRDHEKGSIFQMQAYDKPVRYYKEYYNADSKIGKQQLNQKSEPNEDNFASNQGQFQSNIPNYYAQKESSIGPLKNVQMQNLHQYKVMASENEKYVNYNIYNNEYPQVVDAIKKQYQQQKEQISNEPSFFQKRRAVDYYHPPLAALQYDSPKKVIQQEFNLKLMQPVVPIYVPINDRLPQQYMVVMPQIPQYKQDQDQLNAQTSTYNCKTQSAHNINSDKLQSGNFADGQDFNRFVNPKAERYEQKNRHEFMNKKYKPDLLPRADKAGYNINPHTTSVNVRYQRQDQMIQKQQEQLQKETFEHLQDYQKQQILENEQKKSLQKIFKQ